MAITTVFDTSDYAKTSIAINGEFISTYIDDIDITYDEPVIDENDVLELSQPLIWLEYYGDDFSDIGMGNALNDNKKGEKGTISLWAWQFVPVDLGEGECLSLGAKIKNVYLQHKDDLGEAGIRKPRVGSLRSFSKGATYRVSRQLITFEILMSW